MTLTISRFLKKGYVPLACNKYAGVAWQGEYLKNFWMWNGQFMETSEGERIQTVRVTELKEAALRYWRDGWIPLRAIDAEFLRRMEGALRAHRGLLKEGVKFDDAPFLALPGKVPEQYLSVREKEFIGNGDLR